MGSVADSLSVGVASAAMWVARAVFGAVPPGPDDDLIADYLHDHFGVCCPDGCTAHPQPEEPNA